VQVSQTSITKLFNKNAIPLQQGNQTPATYQDVG
jgi:hypothetical protein